MLKASVPVRARVPPPKVKAGVVMVPRKGGRVRKGHLRGFKIGKEWRVSVEDLEAFLEASANKPMDKPRSIA